MVRHHGIMNSSENGVLFQQIFINNSRPSGAPTRNMFDCCNKNVSRETFLLWYKRNQLYTLFTQEKLTLKCILCFGKPWHIFNFY